MFLFYLKFSNKTVFIYFYLSVKVLVSNLYLHYETMKDNLTKDFYYKELFGLNFT